MQSDLFSPDHAEAVAWSSSLPTGLTSNDTFLGR